MKNIEIPLQSEKTRSYIWLERLPALLTYTVLLLPIILSLIDARLTAVFIIAYILVWFFRGVGINIRVIQGYRRMEQHKKLPWTDMIADIESGEVNARGKRVPSWHAANIERLKTTPAAVKPSEAIHVMMIAAYNESREVIEPTVQSVLDSDFDMKKVILIFAYEERGGDRIRTDVHDLINEYGDKFLYAEAVEHPSDIPHEVIGKGGNITHAARVLQKRLEKLKIDPLRVQLTTLDSDNRPHPQYLNALTYTFASVEEPNYVSFQPIPIYTNNIWDVPALMRVIATGNSFWNLVLSLRIHAIRNFSAHAQGMAALIDTDFWSVRTIVEDGHQYWRTYFRYDGKHEVYPIYVPIYQDAVLSEGYKRTLKAQFIQIRRWAWGASDIAYVWSKGFLTPNNVPKTSLIPKLARLIESHVGWASGPLLLAFSAFIPVFFNPDDIASNQLPMIASYIQRVALAGLCITMFLSFKSLPPKPARYKRHRTIFMMLQWILLPITTICYNSLAALNSQTRLLFGKYLDKFDVTEKAVVSEDGKISS
jgi:cellulose synthase/poly-beta-1,6-N-acetylglucosamine synthase-like glycosyltransferase